MRMVRGPKSKKPSSGEQLRRERPGNQEAAPAVGGSERGLGPAPGLTLNVLDNPDDGEIFDTGDASDFAGEKLNERRRGLPKRQRHDQQ